jgi:hypothetical protein
MGNDSGDLEEQPPDSASAVDKITPFLPPIAAANEMNPDMDAQRVGKLPVKGNALHCDFGTPLRSYPIERKCRIIGSPNS